MAGYTLRQIVRYRFDNFMARGGSSIFICLVLIFLGILISVSSVRGLMLLTVPKENPEASNNDGTPKEIYLERGGGYFRNVYVTFLQMTDPGNMNQDVMSRPHFKITAVLAGLSGVVMLSALIAFITTALDRKITELKKGHSKVVEEGHTLILGWNERVLEILRELFIANESEDDACVVILSPQDKETMDDYLKVHARDFKNTRIVTRSGSVSSLVNLDIVSVTTCKSVIVLAQCAAGGTEAEKSGSDTSVIKTILAVVASRPPDMKLSIVAEIFEDRNRRVVEDISPDEITTVDTNEILAKILVQTSRSVGLSVVYSEVLSFDGCEMYFYDANWGEISFGQLAFHFPDGVPMGLRHADGTLALNPPIDTPLKPDDSILILAEDNSTIDFRPEPVAVPRDLTLAGGRKEQTVERELIIGWTLKVEIILREYADYVLEGSSIDIMLRAPDPSVRTHIERIKAELPDIEINLVEEDPLRTEGLLAVEPFRYDNIIILSQGGEDDDDERTDSETIVILLLLRKIFEKHGFGKTKLITEVLDSENQPLVARTGVHDFIISNRFVSMILAQISEDPDIKRVYDDLFQEEGSEIYLKPASLYFTQFPAEITFADAMRIAQKREEVCLGVKIKALEGDMNQNFGVKLIPEKNQTYRLSPEDALVVLAEDET